MHYAPNPVTPLEIAVTGVLTVVGVAGVVGGVLVSRKAAARPALVTPPPSDSQESRGPYLSGPLRDNDGTVPSRGMILGDGIAKVRRVTAYRGFAYMTVEFLRGDPDWGIEPGQFLFVVQVSPGHDPAEGDNPFATESDAAAGARAWITANHSRLVQVVEGADPSSVGF